MTFPEWDTALFLFLNGRHSPAMDAVMWHVSSMLVFAPLFAYLLYRLWRQLGWRQLALLLAGVALCVLLADRVSSGFFKPFFERLRPTHALGNAVHTVRGYRGGRFGFVSSHAANVFAVAVYTLLVFRRAWYAAVMLPLALLVSYSRIYLGVHYPLDVLCGGLLGAAAGGAVAGLHALAQRRMRERR